MTLKNEVIYLTERLRLEREANRAIRAALKRILTHPQIPAESLQCCRDARKFVSR